MTRRSTYVGFTVFTLSAALAACGGDVETGKEAAVYTSVEQCQKANPGADCEKALREAQLEHLKTAPAAQTRAQCEQEWGDGHCEEHPGSTGGSVFLPMMAGFMLGHALAGPGPGMGQPGCAPNDPRCNNDPGRSGFTGGSHGVYVGRTGGLFSGGSRIGDAEMKNGGYQAPSRAFVSEGAGGKVTGGRVTRGGFGRFGGFHFGGGRGG